MELKENAGGQPARSLLGEIFAATEDNGRSSAAQAQVVQQLHARLASADFAAQMTGIFFEAKREALAGSE